MMVDLNVVYIAAVSPLLSLSLLRVRVSDGAAKAALATACSISMASYLFRWVAAASLPEAAPPILSVLGALV
ncbi:hypothetical protein SB861_66660, partial [Paraburkholderia sp. SIMBA_049]